MNKEIGGDFWLLDKKSEQKSVNEKYYEILLSGRTAIDFIIRDIKANRVFKTACLPSYCCKSMIQPFLDNGIKVSFYDVAFQGRKFCSEYDSAKSSDVVLVLQYFGYFDSSLEKTILELQANGKEIIEDGTHSWFSYKPYHASSDYVFASLRKWTGLPGGALAVKRKGPFFLDSPVSMGDHFVPMRQQAASLKKRYIEEGVGEKEKFLNYFSEAELCLEENYRDHGVPLNVKRNIFSIDYKNIKKARKMNATYLTEKLSAIPNVEVPQLDEKAVPLFIPGIIKNSKRNDLQKYLIKNNIYCPMHWPISTYHKINSTDIYDNVISFVCDQRYTIEDMERIASLVKNFMEASV